MKHSVGKKRKAALDTDRPGFATFYSTLYSTNVYSVSIFSNHYIGCYVTSGKSRNSARDKAFGDREGANTGLVPFWNTGKALLSQLLSQTHLPNGLAKEGVERHGRPKGVCRVRKKDAWGCH